MNLQHLSDQYLLSEAERLAEESREVLTKLLHHLREIERRRLFCVLKYGSLFEYVVKRLKFSESEANRRISAMRLLRDLPEIEGKIATGALSMTNLVMARALFLKEKKAGRGLNKAAKAEVVSKLENQSTREAQRYLGSINPEMKSTKELKFDSIEDEALREKLLKLKGRFAHIDPHMTLGELLHRLCDEVLEKKAKSPSAPKVESKAEITRQIWRRDKGQCTKCGSTFALEPDHIRPRSVGGPSSLENQRLLCRNCNQRAAIEYFGMNKMGKYLKAPTVEYRSRIRSLSEVETIRDRIVDRPIFPRDKGPVEFSTRGSS